MVRREKDFEIGSLLDKSKIHSHLSTSNQGLTIELWDSLPSTNDYLMQQQFTELSARCCLAEQQTQGKGRRGRRWVSPFARNIYLSLLWPFSSTIKTLSMVSLITAIAVVRSLESLNLPTGLGLKWPNDVLWKSKKLAGILIESMDERRGTRPTVIGIGLNVEMPVQVGQQINQAWTDLSTITGKTGLDRNEIAGRLLNELMQNLRLFQDQGFAPFKEAWQALDLTLNKSISIITPTQILQGKGCGINEQGHLLLELEAGEIRAFSSGEVSVSLDL